MASIIRADALQNTNTSNIISQTNATTLTLGYSGQTIAVASGATLLGGGITWTIKLHYCIATRCCNCWRTSCCSSIFSSWYT